MDKLIPGVQRFQNEVFPAQRELFRRLAEGQWPQALFITCSDSRINPNLITQTAPGDLFVLRNAGNIVPPPDAASGAESAAVEYALAALEVEHIVVCGHSQCGAMKGVLRPESLEALPAVRRWLEYASGAREIVEKQRLIQQADSTPTDDVLLRAVTEANVLLQLEHLRAHPRVAERLERGAVQLHGWIYQIESGEIRAYHPARERFEPLCPGTGSAAAR